MKISKLVNILKFIYKDKGDLDVYLSSDSEGNSYGTLGNRAEDSIYYDKHCVILYPFEESLDFNDLIKSKEEANETADKKEN